MASELEAAVRRFLKPILRKIVEEVLRERQVSIPQTPTNSSTNDVRFLLRAREAAKCLAISERHLHKLTAEGMIPCVRLGRLVHYSVETVEEWIRNTESNASPETSTRPTKDETSQAKPASMAVRKPERKNPAGKRTDRKTARSRVKKQRTGNFRQPETPQTQVEAEREHANPFRLLLNEIGIARDDLGPLTNGELMQIAEVDISVFHGWMHLGRDMPEEALERLRVHFTRLAAIDGDQ